MRRSQNAKAAMMLALLASASPVASHGVQPIGMLGAATTAAKSAQSENHAAALQLAKLVVRYDNTLEGARIGFEQSFDQSVKADPNVQAMERKTPGFIAFLHGRMWENAEDGIAIMYPMLVDRTAALFEQELTLGQIKNVITFIQSPTGRKVQSGGLEGVKLDQGYLSCLQEGRQDCASAAMLTDTYQQAGRNVIRTLSVEEMQEIAAFQQTDAGKAFFALSPKIAQISADLVNELLPQLQAKTVGTVKIAVADWHDMQEEKTKP